MKIYNSHKNALISFIIIVSLTSLITFSYLLKTPKYINTLTINDNTNLANSENEKIKAHIISNRQTKTIGYIKEISENNGDIYITFDPVEFYIFDEADVERSIDGIETSEVPYYIRNITSDTLTYALSKDASTNLCEYLVHDSYENASYNTPVTLDKFIEYVNNNITNDNRSLLFWLDIKANNIISTEMQYTP